MVQLLIDSDAQSLKHLRGGMVLAPAAPLDLLDQTNQLAGAFERSDSPLLDDRPREPAGLGLFAVLAKDSRQIIGRVRIDNLARIERLAAVHTHLERRVRAKAEAPFARIDLMG